MGLGQLTGLLVELRELHPIPVNVGIEPGDFLEAKNHVGGGDLLTVARFQREGGDAPGLGGTFEVGSTLAGAIACGAQVIEDGEGADLIAGVESGEGGRAFRGGRDVLHGISKHGDLYGIRAVSLGERLHEAFARGSQGGQMAALALLHLGFEAGDLALKLFDALIGGALNGLQRGGGVVQRGSDLSAGIDGGFADHGSGQAGGGHAGAGEPQEREAHGANRHQTAGEAGWGWT